MRLTIRASTINGKETAAIAIYQLPGSNSLDVAKAVKAKMMDLSRYFPNDVRYKVVLDTTQFVSASIDEVLVTFVETSLIVMLVILIFLQNFRAMIIPSLTIPVSVLATFARDEVDGIFYQYAYSFRPCFGNSYRGGRCDRSGREFDPAYRYGKV